MKVMVGIKPEPGFDDFLLGKDKSEVAAHERDTKPVVGQKEAVGETQTKEPDVFDRVGKALENFDQAKKNINFGSENSEYFKAKSELEAVQKEHDDFLPGKTQTEKPAATTPAAYGANNKIFTEDRANKAREILRKKLNQLNSGLDPELLSAGIELAGYHIEAGARTFADYAKSMISDLGDSIRPYLKSFYNAVRDYPELDNSGMDSYGKVVDFDVNSNEKEAANADTVITGAQGERAPENDRTGGAGKSSGNVPANEIVGRTEGVRPGEGKGNDAGVLHGVERDNVLGGKQGNERPNAKGAANRAKVSDVVGADSVGVSGVPGVRKKKHGEDSGATNRGIPPDWESVEKKLELNLIKEKSKQLGH